MGTTKRQRLSHGERTRLEILDIAEGLATREGLASLSIARLAEEVGMSKGGVFAHFGSKLALQLATIAAARERFLLEVAEPALREPAGMPRLRAAFEFYFAYVARRLPSGGCFFTAATLEMADRPGAVRDEVADFIRARQTQIAQSLREAMRRGEIKPETDTEQLAFELSAMGTGAMVELQMFKSDKTLQRIRQAIDHRLAELTEPKSKAKVRAKNSKRLG